MYGACLAGALASSEIKETKGENKHAGQAFLSVGYRNQPNGK